MFMDRAVIVKLEKTPEVGHGESADLATFLGDHSFSDVTSDDSSGWMHKIDVSNFKELTSGVPAECLGNVYNSPQQLVVNSPAIISSSLGQHLQYQGLLQLQMHNAVSTTSTATYLDNFHRPDFKEKFAASDRPCNRNNSANNRLTCRPDISNDQQLGLVSPTVSSSTKAYPKPLYSYSCLIALALKNSKNGRLQVSEIYAFMCENFPYFRSAQAGWKNSVRHNLSLNKCFEKIVVETAGGHGRKCCLWTLNPNKTAKMEQEIRKWREKDIAGVRESLTNPEDLNLIEMGLKGMPGDQKPIILQTLSNAHCNFFQSPTSVQNSQRNNWFYDHQSRSCLTPPRSQEASAFESRDTYSVVTCPPQVYSPPAFSTPIRRQQFNKCDSPLSLSSSNYSPNQVWRLSSTETVNYGIPLSGSPIAGNLSCSPWKYPPPCTTSTSADFNFCTTPYQSVLSATDPNNSLLQTALSMGCCSVPKVTLQSL